MPNITDRFLLWAKPSFESGFRSDARLSLRLQRRVSLWILNQMIGAAIPFVRRNQFRVLDIRHGEFLGRVSLRKNVNHIGTMYAGAMFLLAEVPGGIIALFEFGGAYFPILKDLKMSYLKPAKSDLTISIHISHDELESIRATADREGKADFTLNTQLLDHTGEVVAESIANYQLRSRHWNKDGAEGKR